MVGAFDFLIFFGEVSSDLIELDTALCVFFIYYFFFYEQPMSITCQSKSERKGIMPLILDPSYRFIYLFIFE
jgi:hypothetical protein